MAEHKLIFLFLKKEQLIGICAVASKAHTTTSFECQNVDLGKSLHYVLILV
jgi:hypothetical protein